MKNFKFKIANDILTIEIDLSKEHGLSKTGRSVIVSSTLGNLRLYDANGYRPEKINLTVCKDSDPSPNGVADTNVMS
jgi:hypothetical protein